MVNYSEIPFSLNDLSDVFIMLGASCNMTCRHCVQTPIKNTLKLSPCGNTVSEDVISFISKWSKLPWKYARKRRIYFWGGEPLLYWQSIKEMITRFNIICSDNIEYNVYSNGLLLNDEIVDFCNTNNVHFTMSYDAPNPTAVRNTYPDDNKCSLFMKLNYRTVNTVFCALNKDMVSAFSFLEDKFPNTLVTCGFINVLSEMPEDIWKFKQGDVRKAVLELFEVAKGGNYNAQMWFNTKFARMNFDIYEFETLPFPPCRPGLGSLSLNIKGNIFRCHNDGVCIGNIKEPFSKLFVSHLNTWKALLPKNCYSCDVVDICRCCCPIAMKTADNRQLVQCSFLKELWRTIKEVDNKGVW